MLKFITETLINISAFHKFCENTLSSSWRVFIFIFKYLLLQFWKLSGWSFLQITERL